MTVNFKNAIANAIDSIESQYNSRIFKYSCGYYDLDDIMQGFLKSQLTVFAGRPSMGKTSFALNIACNFALSGAKVLFISCEMNCDIIMQRIISSQAEVSLDKLLKGNMSEDDWEKVAKTVDELNNPRITENLKIEPSFTDKFDKLSQLITDFSSKNKDCIVIIDYFQLLNRQAQVQDRYVELADLASSIKRLAVENNIHIILLSQISRKVDERLDKTPQISDLSECDALAQHADNILFINRDEYWNKYDPDLKNKASIIVSKVKNSSPCTVDLLFFGSMLKFKNKMIPM